MNCDRNNAHTNKLPCVELAVSDLVSWIDHKNREAFLSMGFDFFDKAICDTPHYRILAEAHRSVQDLSQSEYVRYKEARRELLGRNKVKYMSGEARLQRFLGLFDQIEKSGRIDPILVEYIGNGRYRIADGLHRAAIALRLGFSTIPACIRNAGPACGTP